MTGILKVLEKGWERASRAFDHNCGAWTGPQGFHHATFVQDMLRAAHIETKIEGNKSEIRLWCEDSEEYFWPLPGESFRHEADRLLITEHELRKSRGLR